MALKCRGEIVGKRFLSVSGVTTKLLKSSKISEWGWRAGVIRAATHKEDNHPDLQVLVEYDDLEWQRREWISIYKDDQFHLFLIEKGLVWAERDDPFVPSYSKALWPALTFTSLVSVKALPTHLQPVEFLFDRDLAFTEEEELKPFKEWDPSLPGVRDYPELRTAIRQWAEQQDGQRILLTTPSVLVGYRVEVYRAEGTTQWYTAVIIGYNEATRDLTLTDDTVLEEHSEDPALVQMRLIGDGVVESIMRGDNIGITVRRSRSAILQTHQQTRVGRSFPNISTSPSVNSRTLRTGKFIQQSVAVLRNSPEADKVPTKSTKRKASESEQSAQNKFSHIKEDLENKQRNRRKTLCIKNRKSNKKKILEEATNSKLRDELHVDACLQNTSNLSVIICRSFEEGNDADKKIGEIENKLVAKNTSEASSIKNTSNDVTNVKFTEDSIVFDDRSNDSNIELVLSEEVASSDHDQQVRCESMPTSKVLLLASEIHSEEDDCVIVSTSPPQGNPNQKKECECSSRGDDDVPLSSSSPFASRMELSDPSVSSFLRFSDDRSDSGVSSLRSGSGDERSGSRSSALSSSDDTTTHSQNTTSNNRSPLFIPSSIGQPTTSNEPVRVWRDPNLLLESEPHVRHIHSVQHQTLLMSHPTTPAASGPPPTSAANHTTTLYPPVPQIPNLISPHALHPHHHLAPQIYHPHPLTDLWKQRYGQILPVQPIPEELAMDRVAIMQDRHERMIIRERQNQEIEKQKEKERLERERQEREKIERDQREREKQEREREEKERQEKALNSHFEKSLRSAHKPREQQWNPIGGRPPQPRTSSLSEDDRKRTDQEHQQRHLSIRSDARDHRSYYSVQRPPSVPTKSDYPPPAHSRINANSKTEKLSTMHSSLPKSELNIYNYPVCHHPQNTFFEPKNKSQEHHKSQSSSSQSGLIVTKSSATGDMRDQMSSNPPPLVSEMKNSVIVKHEGASGSKNTHNLDGRVPVPHSPSPKLRNEMLNHYMPQTPKQGLYEYHRSPTQSPHHMSHTPSPHHQLLEPQNLGKSSSQHHRPSSQQLPSPHHQRQSPHHLAHNNQQVPTEMRYRSSSESQAALIYPSSASGSKSGYPFLPTSSAALQSSGTSNVSNSKPKVSSPAPHHIYGKPSSGVVSVVPVTRTHESVANPIQLTSKPPLSVAVSPCPYQQVPQYHAPHHQTSSMMTCPPPAHSSRTTTNLARDQYDRYNTTVQVPGGLSVKLPVQHGTSPPTAASAPLSGSRSHPNYSLSPASDSGVQTQPLDLGVSSNKYDPALSPKRKAINLGSSSGSLNTPVSLEIKKRRLEGPVNTSPQSQMSANTLFHQTPQLARVSEPSPLIASAATTITTVVNTAAYRTPSVLLTENLPDVSVTAVNINLTDTNIEQSAILPMVTPPRPESQPNSNNSDGSIVSRNNATPTPLSGMSGTVTISEESPSGTPIKIPVTPSSVDSEKSNSPGPNKTSSSQRVRHMKKAWLQRHTGEDVDEDTSDVIGSGSCVTLPIIKTAANTANNKENPVNSIHSVGSMAVNSINKTKHFSNKNSSRKKDTATVNGINVESSKTTSGAIAADDSSSSDQERGRKSPPKRKPPKVKRKKGGGAATPANKPNNDDKKRKTSGGGASGNQSAVPSESGSESEKESGSDKDSDSGASSTLPGNKKNVTAAAAPTTTSNNSTTNSGNTSGKTGTNSSNSKEPRKRGRRPKSSKNDKGEEPRPKKSKDDILPQRDPFRKPPVGQLKKTGESFLQDGPCFEVAPKLAKCRECRWTPNQRSKNMPNIFCRFYAFRRLRYTKNGQLAIAGFSDPHKDALEDDLKLWLPDSEVPPADLDLETSRFLLNQVGDHFCDLLVQEKEAHLEHMSDDKTVAWKRVVQGVREMCDVCETTLFNFHWACRKCGFVVCLDCYKSRKNGSIKVWGEPGKDRDEYSWLLCTNRQAHEQEKLMLTQIIAGESLIKLGKMVHEMRELWNIEQYCACPTSKEVSQKSQNNVAYKDIVRNILLEKVNGFKKEVKEEDIKPCNGVIKEEKTSPLSWLADVALSNEDKKNDETSSDSEDGNYSTLRELLIRPSHKPNGSRAGSPVSNNQQKNSTKKSNSKGDTLDDVISSVIEDSVPKSAESTSETKSELKHFVRRYNWQAKGRAPIPIRIMTLTESKTMYPDVPHSWLCDGKLLRLSDPGHKGNSKIFQDQWKRGQPVIVSDVTKALNKDLWNPDAFARDFGDEKNDLVNCMTGNLVPNQPMRKFWEGFDHFSKRLRDDRGNPMLLKLKDWPPGEDFAEMLPTRFNDLMKVLPLPEYTHRTGRLNLASRLPDCFVRPDLGPKMYNAYGSALYPSKGTTNLHLDISDAVNVMVYVGIPKDGDSDEHIKEAFRAIDEAGCDILTRRRVRDKGELPGALWHIYNARDADKIRDLLNKVVVEKGGRLEPHNDPIHDQSCYLDGPLRERLYKEYGVEGYAIVQCLGDAVFIPAGAPHQVRNLHNCIKVAEDFVSPENVSHCFHLTQEFRDLSDTHSNHEDKLQIKNIIYHAVKDSLGSLSAIVSNYIKTEKDSNCIGNNDNVSERNGGSGNSTTPVTLINSCGAAMVTTSSSPSSLSASTTTTTITISSATSGTATDFVKKEIDDSDA